MANKSRSKSQRRADTRALKVLRDTGLYGGKIDLRKSPTSYQRSQINKFADVISGAAQVVRPADPKSFRSLFRVKGDAVIVPVKKGERATVGPKGGLIIEKKVAGRKVSRRYIKKEKIARPLPLAVRKSPPHRYGLPFNRGKGESQIFWFPSYDELIKFMAGYNYKDWQNYVIVEYDEDGSQLFAVKDGQYWYVDEQIAAGAVYRVGGYFDEDMQGNPVWYIEKFRSQRDAQAWIDELLDHGG